MLSSPAWPHLIYLDSWTQHSRFLRNISLHSIRPSFHHQSHPHWALFSLGSASSFLLELFLCSSWVAYWTPSNLRGSSSRVISFCPFILFMGSHGKNTGVVCHSLFQWTAFCQNLPPWPVHLGWPCMARLIASLSSSSPFTTTRLWSMEEISTGLLHSLFQFDKVKDRYLRGSGSQSGVLWPVTATLY